MYFKYHFGKHLHSFYFLNFWVHFSFFGISSYPSCLGDFVLIKLLSCIQYNEHSLSILYCYLNFSQSLTCFLFCLPISGHGFWWNDVILLEMERFCCGWKPATREDTELKKKSIVLCEYCKKVKPSVGHIPRTYEQCCV